MIRFGMCGCGGFIERAVLPMMMRVENAKPVAAFDMNTDSLGRVCSSFNIENKCGSFEELLEQKNVDVIYIASPNVFHKDQVVMAAKAGKHVFCQKPMGMNAVECEEMLKACKENNVKIGMGFCYRFQGAQELVKKMIEEGTIGKVSYIHFSFNLGGYNPETAGWRCDPKMSGGGPLMDIAPHIIDLAPYLMGDRVESVISYVWPEKTEKSIELDVDAIMQLEKGGRISMNTSFVRGDMHNYTVVGKNGMIRAVGTMCWNNQLPGIGKGKLFIDQGMETKEVDFQTEEHIEKEIKLFCQALENGEEPPVSGRDGLQVQKIVDAIYEAGKTGKRIII